MIIDALGDNDSIMDGTQLFSKLRRPVMVATQQTPQFADVRQAGHDGGDFLFVRKRSTFRLMSAYMRRLLSRWF